MESTGRYYLYRETVSYTHLIHQTWHGAEGDIYYLVSEKGFNRLPTKKKTFCMELNVEKKKEKKIMYRCV